MDVKKCFFWIPWKVCALWTKVLELFVLFGDVMVDFIACYVLMFDGVDFSDFDEDLSWLEDDSTMELHNFKRDTFNAHNNYRTLHGCPPLIMSEELTNTAQAWADKLTDKGVLQYSENPHLGENVSIVDLDQPPSRKGEQLVKDWYKEIDNYNYSKPGWKRGAHHVSQLLWKSTTEIGIGIAKIPGQKKAYAVVNYRPAGNNNMPGEFERNVLPPQKRIDDNANLRKNMHRR